MSQMPPPSLEDLPPSIKNIILEIGPNKMPQPEQLERLYKALQDEINAAGTTPLKILNDVKNSQKVNNGKPMVDKKILSLYILMFGLFMSSNGKYYKNEIEKEFGEEIKSYGNMPNQNS